MSGQRYWTGPRRGRISRRTALGRLGATAAGSAVSGATMAGCSSTTKRQSGSGASSAGPASAGPPKPGGTLNTALPVNPPTLDVHKTISIPATGVAGHVMSRLFRHKTGPDPATALNPELENDLGIHAESPDGLTWTIKLRPDAKFQNIAPVNGHAVEAEDVKASFIRALTLPDSAAKSFLSVLDPNQIQAPATDTIVFKLKFPSGIFSQTVTSGTLGSIYPREALAGSYDPTKQVIGCGPFILDSYTPDVAVVYKKNPDWFGKPEPYIDGERSAIIPDASQRVAQFSAGNLDELSFTQSDLDAVKRGRPNALILTAPASNPYFTLFSHLDHPASAYRDIRVRQAISMAIDRTAIGQAAFNGVYHANGELCSSLGRWALPPDQLGSASQYHTYNPQAAKQLLAQSGAADQLKKFVYPNKIYGPAWDTIAQALNPMLNAVGFKTELVAVDYASEFINVGKGILYGHFDDDTLAPSNWISPPPAEQVIYDGLMPNGSNNHTHIDDPDLTAMITKMIAIQDEQERLKAVQDIQRYVAEKLYQINGIPTGNVYTAVQSRVRGYNYSVAPNFEGSETYAKLWLAG